MAVGLASLVRSLVLVASLAVVVLTATPPRAPLRHAGGLALPRAGLLLALLPGYPSLLADFYWVQQLHQVGLARTVDEHADIFGYADLVTDLDPRFLAAYQVAAIAIPLNRGRESWANGDEARRITEKGLKVFPRDISLRQNLAHQLMYFDRDYRRAADVLKALSEEPHAPAFLAQLATRLYAQAGDFDAGLEFARAVRDSATTDEQKQFFDHRVKEIEAERVLQQVEAGAFEFSKRNGRQPANLNEVLAAGDLKTLPEDPLGGAIYIDAFGRARSTAAQFRLELYEDTTKALAREGRQ